MDTHVLTISIRNNILPKVWKPTPQTPLPLAPTRGNHHPEFGASNPHACVYYILTSSVCIPKRKVSCYFAHYLDNIEVHASFCNITVEIPVVPCSSNVIFQNQVAEKIRSKINSVWKRNHISFLQSFPWLSTQARFSLCYWEVFVLRKIP